LIIPELRVDIEEYERQKSLLKYYLTEYETGQDKFVVLNNEAGFSKSKLTDSCIINETRRKYLLVKKYNDEKYQSYENMMESIEVIWGNIPSDYVVVINANNSYDYENVLVDRLTGAQVVIISHEKYKLLSRSGKIGLYKKDRHTMIIDEYMEVPIVTINASYFNKIRSLFPKDLGRDEFSKIEDLFADIIEKEKDVKNMHLVKLQKYKRILEELLNELETFYDANYDHYDKILEKLNNNLSHYDYKKFFTDIKSIISNQAIYSPFTKSISTYKSFDFWTLKNNIILDASGDILSEYKLNPQLFEIVPQKKVFDYSNTTVHIKRHRSYKSTIDIKFNSEGKDNSKERYFKPIVKFIKANHFSADQTLIINYLEHQKYFKELQKIEGIYLSYHGNILGKNDWRECNKLFINSTFNLPEEAYLLIYSFYSGKRLRKTDFRIETKDHRCFKKKIIEQLKQNFILHNFYQEIKRINRDLIKEAHIYVITDNEYFISKIPELMKNVNVKFDYNIELPEINSNRNSLKERPLYIAIKDELERIAQTDLKDAERVSKKQFCQNVSQNSQDVRITTADLKKKFNRKYIKELCESYGVDYKRTFKKHSRYIYFKKQAQI